LEEGEWGVIVDFSGTRMRFIKEIKEVERQKLRTPSMTAYYSGVLSFLASA